MCHSFCSDLPRPSHSFWPGHRRGGRQKAINKWRRCNVYVFSSKFGRSQDHGSTGCPTKGGTHYERRAGSSWVPSTLVRFRKELREIRRFDNNQDLSTPCWGEYRFHGSWVRIDPSNGAGSPSKGRTTNSRNVERLSSTWRCKNSHSWWDASS